MKVTIGEVDRGEALDLLMGPTYLQMLEEIMAWMQGPGRESSMESAVEELKRIAVIHGVAVN